MSALLLGKSVEHLTHGNQTALVIFIVLFPLIVLCAFCWLIARHHQKLYAPSDYKTDDSFLQANGLNEPANIGDRLREEIEEERKLQTESKSVPVEEKSKIDGAQTTKKERSKETAPPTTSVNQTVQKQLIRGYMIENLVFQDLQERLGGSVRREVRVNSVESRALRADGIIELADRNFVVEVKRVRKLEALAKIVTNGLNQLTLITSLLKHQGYASIKPLFVIVIETDSDELEFKIKEKNDGIARRN